MPPAVPTVADDYGQRIDFNAFQEKDEDFRRLLAKNDGRLDWKNASHVMHLCKTQLKIDFGLTIDLPDDRLCPPIPVRYAYIKWIQNLIDTTSDTYSDSYQPSREVLGIDIGVGSSCIYPLLGTTVRPNWRFLGTELDQKNYEYARRNVMANDLTMRIKLLKVSGSDQIPQLDTLGIKAADFTMCNPPFYISKEDMQSTWSKSELPSAPCSGAEVEMITEGGDVGFVLRMIEESRSLGTRVQWYTSMLGKLSSARAITSRLKEIECRNWAVTTLHAGVKTRRWVVGWSWRDLRPTNDVARNIVPHKELLPLALEFPIRTIAKTTEAASAEINKLMDSLNIAWFWKQDLLAGVAFAKENVWSRSARRRKQRQIEQSSSHSHEMDVDDDDNKVEPEAAALGVKISVTPERIIVRWLQGFDYILFESFCGMLKRSLANST